MSESYVSPLPPHPDLEQQRRLAKELLEAVQAGEPEALARAAALHPSFDRTAFLLADAQLVIARGYGFASWARLKARIESLDQSPVDRFVAAVLHGEVEAVRAILAEHAEVAERINDPLFYFDSPAVLQARSNLPLLDLLLEHGADINARSQWWAGSFGILDGVTPEQAAPLIARGAQVDVWSAAGLGDLARLRELIEADPSLVHARGGDGQTPLHFAANVEVAEYLLACGAELDVRCVDHESTPAQWAIGERPDVARYLVERGAWYDIFLAVALGDLERARQCYDADPACLGYRVGEGFYRVRHNGRTAATPEQIGDGRGDVYRWSLRHETVPGLAGAMGGPAVLEWVLAHSTPAQRLVALCEAGEAEPARRVAAEHPDLVDSLGPGDLGRLANAARDRNRAAVELMLELGFPIDAAGQEGGTPLHWAAWRADLAIVELLLEHHPPLETRDPTHDSTPLGWAVHGSQYGWDRDRPDDYGPVVRRLIAAGCAPEPAMLPCRNEAVDVVLREAMNSA